VKKALQPLAVAAVALGFAGCGDKPKEPTIGGAARDAIKQGKESAKEVKAKLIRAAKEAVTSNTVRIMLRRWRASLHIKRLTCNL